MIRKLSAAMMHRVTRAGGAVIKNDTKMAAWSKQSGINTLNQKSAVSRLKRIEPLIVAVYSSHTSTIVFVSESMTYWPS